ncbi:MAG: imidazole glycerol phosphate synthase subunit HisF [Actinomycetota bacterium]
MPAIRVIPCLDVSAGRVVKGVNFENLRDSGDPVELAANYYNQGADEITFLDVTATNENRSTTYGMVTHCAEQVFIPLTVGGGIREVSDVSKLLASGADKVSVGSAGIARPELLREIAEEFGNQVLVVSLDLKRADTLSGFGVTSNGGRNLTKLDAMEWIERVQQLGAGELLINSIDADGTRDGFDLELISKVRSISNVPIIASGGAGTPQHFVEAALAGADALLAASVFHESVLTVSDVKIALRDAQLEVR